MMDWLVPIASALLTALGALVMWLVNRRRPALDTAQAAEIESKLLELKKAGERANGEARAELSRTTSVAATDMITMQSAQAAERETRIAKLREEIDALRDCADKHERQIDGQKDELLATTARIAELERQVGELRAEKDALHAALKQLQTK